jgi:osmotically-inducible protein OsmY
MNRNSRNRSPNYKSPIYGNEEVMANYEGVGRGFTNPNDSYDRQPDQMYEHDYSKDNWGQDEFLDENTMKGSRSMHDRAHYGSAKPDFPRSFAGVGPKGYKRSDERIEEEVCNILLKDRNIDASDIEVRVQNGLVILSGTVESRMDRTEAELAIEGVAGVEDIQNDIKLKKWGDYSDRPYQHQK